jgi:hypothetical protein
MEIIKFDKIRKNLWYVSTMDQGLCGIYTKKRIAIAYSSSAGGDHRIKRLSRGEYQLGRSHITKGSSIFYSYEKKNIDDYNKSCDEEKKYWYGTGFKCHECNKIIKRYDMNEHLEDLHKITYFPSDYHNEEISLEC